MSKRNPVSSPLPQDQSESVSEVDPVSALNKDAMAGFDKLVQNCLSDFDAIQNRAVDAAQAPAPPAPHGGDDYFVVKNETTGIRMVVRGSPADEDPDKSHPVKGRSFAQCLAEINNSIPVPNLNDGTPDRRTLRRADRWFRKTHPQSPS